MRRTIAFFVKKGFLSSMLYPRPYRGLLTLDDILWACEHAAPDLYALVPIARLKFPRHLPGPVPADLRQVMDALRAGSPTGPDFRGQPYPFIRRLMDFQTTDRRASPRIMTSIHLRAPPDVARRIRAAARAGNMTISDWMIEAAERNLNSFD